VTVALAVWVSPELMTFSPAVVRLLRFGKLMRIVRIMRSTAYSLKLLVASIQASFDTLFWSLCVLLLIQGAAAMLLAQCVESYLHDETRPLDERMKVFGYYGTFWRSIVTMFEITFANWAPPCRLLLDDVSELFGIFFLVYRCAIGFAVLNVIQAVFIQQTMKSAQLDDDYMIQEKTREKLKYIKRLRRVFEMLDESGDGFVCWEEFEPVLKTDQMKCLMSSLEIDVADLETLFNLLDGGEGMISAQEFISGLQSMKGNAKALDVITMQSIVKRIEMKVDAMTKGEHRRSFTASASVSAAFSSERRASFGERRQNAR